MGGLPGLRLLTGLTSGLFKPGSLLIQEDLCRQFRVSRTPVRDALTHLQAEGFVAAIPNKGVVIRELSVKEVFNIYAIRILLESAAAKDAAQKCRKDKFAKNELRKILKEVLRLKQRGNLNFQSARKTGNKLRRFIITASGNQVMREILERLGALIDVSRIPFRESGERIGQINQEHIEIIKAVLKGDGEMAGDLVRTHLSLSREAHLGLLLKLTYDQAISGDG